MPIRYSQTKERAITILAILGMIGASVAGGFTVKAQYLYVLKPCPTCDPVDFKHEYMMTLMMFVAEFLSIVIWIPEHFCAKKKGKIPPLTGNKKYFKFFPHIFCFMVPTMCDIIGSTLLQIATFNTLPSIVQMIRQANVLFVSMISLAIFPHYRATYDLPYGIGVLLITIGCVIISYAAAFFGTGSDQDATKNNTLGVIMSILGTIFGSLFLVTEEIFLKNIEMESSLVVTCEGGWGLLFQSFLMPIYQHFDDPFSTDVPKPKMENCYGWWYQTTQSASLTAIIAVDTVITLFYNVCGCEITNRVSAATRSTFDTIKIIFIWIISLAVKWETWHKIGSPIRVVGFLILTLGVFLYNNVLQFIPFLRQVNKEKYGPVGTQCKKCCGRKNEVNEAVVEETVLSKVTPSESY